MRPGLALLCLLCLFACQETPPPDTSPPEFLGSRLASPSSLEIRWGEVVTAQAEFEGHATRGASTGQTTILELPPGLVPGRLYAWAVSAHDAAGNTVSVRGTVRGPNDHPAELRFNEVRFSGNRERGDAVEFVVVAAGNLGGLQLTLWKSAQQSPGWVFPAREVSVGQFVVVRFHAGQGTPERTYDFPGAPGLSGSVGILTLGGPSEGGPTQNFIWAKRPGEGLAMARKVGIVAAEGTERGVEGCTPTRTWSRQPDGHWIITATGGATFGAPNSLTPWIRKPSSPKSGQTPTSTALLTVRPLRPSTRGVPDASAMEVPDPVQALEDSPSRTPPGAEIPPEALR